jgi:hypothetical protein
LRFKKTKTPETILKNAAKKLLAMYHIITWPMTAGLGSEPGIPDRIGILPGGRFLAIEFKSNGRKLTPAQEEKKHQIEKSGGIFIVCRSLDDLIEGLNLPGRLF